MKAVGTAPNRTILRTQAVSPSGPGAILDISGESFVACDTTHWVTKMGKVPETYTNIELARLQQVVGAPEGFYMPPAGEQTAYGKTPGIGLPYDRFPQWLFCQNPKCRVMTKWQWHFEAQLEGKLPGCSACKSEKPLVPMRFVVACPGGHLADVPWVSWAHQGWDMAQGGRCISPVLAFMVEAEGGHLGLASLWVKCRTCGSSASLSGLTDKNSLSRVGYKCPGKQPWQAIVKPCDKEPRVLERGASNVYYPIIASALDIPTEQEVSPVEDEVRRHGLFSRMDPSWLTDETQQQSVALLAQWIATDIGITPEEVLAILAKTDAASSSTDGATTALSRDVQEELLFQEEYAVLLDPPVTDDPRPRFQAERVPIDPQAPRFGMEKLFDQVTLVHRLREVRALTGFTRVLPGGDDSTIVPPDLGRSLRWLPGYDIYGEGIFIKFNTNELVKWETMHKASLQRRLAPIRKSCAKSHIRSLPKPSARFILLHSFAHLLIRELAYQCGYPAASLRERIYCEEPDMKEAEMAGVLIYTADSDAEGSLGGLVRQGKLEHLQATLRGMLSRATWCSADPICLESKGSSGLSLSLASCHSCCLIPETSCCYYNTLLDRYLLVGSPSGDSREGFFQPMLERLFPEHDDASA